MNKLLRTKNRIIGGVCGGIAKWLDVDSTLIRLVFAALALGCGIGVGFYILCWIIIPEED
jgi:phage shock protein C